MSELKSLGKGVYSGNADTTLAPVWRCELAAIIIKQLGMTESMSFWR